MWGDIVSSLSQLAGRHAGQIGWERLPHGAMNGFLIVISQGDPLALQASVAEGFSTSVPWWSVTSQSLMTALLVLSLVL